MTKLVLDLLDIPDRWYEIALSKAAPLVRVLLAKSNGSHVTHKYIMKKPDGKGGWVYYYRKENGELYSSSETPQRNVDQWLATVRGAMSRLRKQMGENPTPAQTSKMEKLKAEQSKAMAAKKAGKTHASADEHHEDKPKPEKKPSEIAPEVKPEIRKTPGRAIRDDFDEENKNVMQSWDLPIGEKLAFYEKKVEALRAIKARATAWINDAGSRSEMDERREDTSDIYAASDRVEATLRKVREEHSKSKEQETSEGKMREQKRTATMHADAAKEFSKEMARNGDRSSASYDKLSGLYSRAAVHWKKYAQDLHESHEKAKAYEEAQDYQERAQTHAANARMQQEQEKPKPETEAKTVNEQLSSNPKFDAKNGMYSGLPPEAGKVFKHEGKPTIWLASLVDASDKRRGYGGQLMPVNAVRGDYAVHGSKDAGWSVTHIPTGMSVGHGVGSLAEATDYANHMDAAGVKIEGPTSSVFGMGNHKEKGAAPIQYDMKKMSEAAKSWSEKRDAKRTEKAQAPKKARAPRKPREPNPKQEKQDAEWYDEEKSKELPPKDYAMGLRAHVKKLKNLDPNIASISSGYTGSGGQSHQRQYIVRFKDGTRPLDFFIRDGEVTKGVYGDVIGFSTKGKSFEETIQNLAKRTRAHANSGMSVKKAKERITMSNAHDYPAHIRKSFRIDGPDQLSKGLYKFAPYNGKSMPKIDDEYLPAYLDAFIEEAYEHECREKAHGENTMGRVGDMADYWATFVFHELVSYMPSNANLSAACKKLGVDATYIAQRIRDLNLLTPQNDYATVQGDFMGGYMDSEIATAGLVRKGGSLYDEVFAASETERSHGAIDRGRLAKSDREYVHLEGGEDPMDALRKSADARDAALGSLYGTDDAVAADPKAGLNWFDR